jgi:hypothetical protein
MTEEPSKPVQAEDITQNTIEKLKHQIQATKLVITKYSS